jgi:hypothetical protein
MLPNAIWSRYEPGFARSTPSCPTSSSCAEHLHQSSPSRASTRDAVERWSPKNRSPNYIIYDIYQSIVEISAVNSHSIIEHKDFIHEPRSVRVPIGHLPAVVKGKPVRLPIYGPPTPKPVLNFNVPHKPRIDSNGSDGSDHSPASASNTTNGIRPV